MSRRRYYAGIGSRKTPEHIQRLMTEIAKILEERRWILRSGGADGADLAFENGVTRYKEIYYKDNYSFNHTEFKDYEKSDWDFATEMFKKYHPSKGNISSEKSRKLLTRNTFQVFGLGDSISNSEFIICYTPDGAETSTSFGPEGSGGTGQAIRIAIDYEIPVYNLKNYIGVSAVEMVDFILKELDEKTFSLFE